MRRSLDPVGEGTDAEAVAYRHRWIPETLSASQSVIAFSLRISGHSRIKDDVINGPETANGLVA